MARYPYILRSVTRGSPCLAKLAAIRNEADVSSRKKRKRLLLRVVQLYRENFRWIRNVRRIRRNTRWLLDSLLEFIDDEGYDQQIMVALKTISVYKRLI